MESEIIYQSLSVDEGTSFKGIAHPRANPFAEELPAAPMAELRQRVTSAEACYRKALEIIRAHIELYDPEFVQVFVELIAKLDPPSAGPTS